MEQTTVLTSTGRAVDLVETQDPEEAERIRIAAHEILGARTQDRATLKNAHVELNRIFSDLASTQAALVADSAENVVAGLCDGSAPHLDPALKDLGQLQAKITIYTSALALLVEHKLPQAEIAVMDAEFGLKMAAAAVIDARRWARLRQHTEALGDLAESEGGVEVRPARFLEEEKLANELRAQAFAIRERRDAMVAALR